MAWADKPLRAFWRGGTARNSGLRDVLIHCGKDSRHRGKGVTFDMKNAVRNWPKTWAGPMDTCQYKLAVFAQGYGCARCRRGVGGAVVLCVCVWGGGAAGAGAAGLGGGRGGWCWC